MTDYPVKKNAAHTFQIGLPSVANSGKFQIDPTLATGDVKISKDGGALSNLATLPVVTPAGSSIVEIVLTSTEMNADTVVIVFTDAAGDEWTDVIASIQTAAAQFGDLATQTKQDASDTKIDELHKLEGLDSSNPVTTTPTSRDAGSISQVISGDGITTSTVTRP